MRLRRTIQRALTPILARAIRLYLELVWRTSRIDSVGETWETYQARYPLPYIGVFWHGRIFYPAWLLRGPSFAAVVALHPDAELMSRYLDLVGTRQIRGSSLHRREKVLVEALFLLRQGVSVGINPDGPVGPERKAKLGAVALASASGAPLIPFSWATRRHLVIRSWDRLLIPLPFSRCVVVGAEPLVVPQGLAEAELEPWRAELEARLEAATEEADRRVLESRG